MNPIFLDWNGGEERREKWANERNEYIWINGNSCNFKIMSKYNAKKAVESSKM